jgi:exonuclease SbcC
MRLLELHLKAFGPFTDRVLSLGTADQRLVLVHGLNEAGKSSTMRAISGLRFGIPERTLDDFLHDKPLMRVGGVFADSAGRYHSLIRRKGRGSTLKLADFANGGSELADPVPPEISALLTGGLTTGDYETMFSLDHPGLRAGGQALARGEGEVGAALFEASSGVIDLAKVLGELNEVARKYFVPAANARNARINQALADFKQNSDRHRAAQVRPSKWEQLARDAETASAVLQEVERTERELRRGQSVLKELISVLPTLDLLLNASRAIEELHDVRLLDDGATSARSVASRGLADARADEATATAAVLAAEARIASLRIDETVLAVREPVAGLHAASAAITGLAAQLAEAEADVLERTGLLSDAGRRIDANRGLEYLLVCIPAPAAKARLQGALDQMSAAELALASHERLAPVEVEALPVPAAPADVAAEAALRVGIEQVNRHHDKLARLVALPSEIKLAQRDADARLTALGLADEAAARCAVPVLSASIEAAQAEISGFSSERQQRESRIEDMSQAKREKEATKALLLAPGVIPTRDDVHAARAKRLEVWALVRDLHPPPADAGATALAQRDATVASFEELVVEADAVVDALVRDYERVSALEAAKTGIAGLDVDMAKLREEIAGIDEAVVQAEGRWNARLHKVGIAAMAPSLLREWQQGLGTCLAKLDALQSKIDEQDATKELQQSQATTLRAAISRTGLTAVDAAEPLDTLIAIAGDDLRQLEHHRTEASASAVLSQERARQLAQYATKRARLQSAVEAARMELDRLAPMSLLSADCAVAIHRARLSEFDDLAVAQVALQDALHRQSAATRGLTSYRDDAARIAEALGEPPPVELVVAAGAWRLRLNAGLLQEEQRRLDDAERGSALATEAESRAKAVRHTASLLRQCEEAGVASELDLPAAEQSSARKRQLLYDAERAADTLSQTTRRSQAELITLLAGRDMDALRAEEEVTERELDAVSTRLPAVRSAEEAARRALDEIDASDLAAEAADAAARSAATVRQSLPLQMRARLSHALLQDAVRRFKERTQAPMLLAASRYFAEITGGEFEALISDDSEIKPVIRARRPGGVTVSVDGMSEGTRDQLYLALRLAALELQRARGVNLPVILDDVLITSDDVRAGCILKALASFSEGGQVIVFTHHDHLCDIAARNVGADRIAIVGLTGGRAIERPMEAA